MYFVQLRGAYNSPFYFSFGLPNLYYISKSSLLSPRVLRLLYTTWREIGSSCVWKTMERKVPFSIYHLFLCYTSTNIKRGSHFCLPLSKLNFISFIILRLCVDYIIILDCHTIVGDCSSCP